MLQILYTYYIISPTEPIILLVNFLPNFKVSMKSKNIHPKPQLH